MAKGPTSTVFAAKGYFRKTVAAQIKAPMKGLFIFAID